MPKKNTAKLEQLQLRASIDTTKVSAESRTVPLRWTTGAKVLRRNWDTGERFYEQLSLDPKHVRMDRLASGNAPLLNTHSTWDLRDVMGVIEKASIDAEGGDCMVRFSKRAEVEPYFQDVLDGIIRNVSVGYNVRRFERQPLAEGETIPTYLATDWEPSEVSLVPVGADAGAGVRSEEKDRTHECLFINEIATVRGEKETEMPPEITPEVVPAVQTPASPAVDKEAIRREGQVAERKRASEIHTAVRQSGLEAEFATSQIEAGTTIEEVRRLIIEKLAERDNSSPTRNQRIEAGAQDEKEVRRLGMEDALLARAYFDHKPSDNGRQYRGMSIVRMAEEYLGASVTRGMSGPQVATRALSSSDFPLILANVAEKMLMKSYDKLPKTFDPFVAQGTLNDYKPAYRYQVGDAPSLAEVREGSEYTYGSFGEKAESTQLKDYGKILKFTRQMIINDDLQAFQRVIDNFGASAARLESALVYGILTGNPAMADTELLFSTAHANIAGTPAAINETSLALLEAQIMNQLSLDGLDYLGLVAKYLICGTAKKVQAQKLLASVVSNKADNVNPFQNAYQLIVDPRVSGTKWFLACSPSDISTIEVARLIGETGPVVDQKEGWNSDGLEVKCRHTVGVKALEWKGMAYNAGA